MTSIMHRALRTATLSSLLLASPLLAQDRPDPYAAPYMESMTWTEIRDAIAGGKKVAIIPTGGTEQNGPHMVMGKHNYIVTFSAGVLAQRLGNALVAPTLQYVPEGDYNRPNWGDKPGVISLPDPAYEKVLDAAVRSLKVHGFTDIILIGDSGPNQRGMTNIAKALNAEWGGAGVRVHAITDYYEQGRILIRDYLNKTYGWSEQVVGSHAGTSDTSQLLYVFAQGIRKDKLAPNGGSPDAGVQGDPTKASVEIGKIAIDFKVNAAIKQFKAAQSP
ncbi:MAG: creatininase family protein [Gemmatimonadaceae bacterium]|jgi:creatinine amidohydrolase|nr:creatininase family protein [Gemmatimonadaceae bacterium]